MNTQDVPAPLRDVKAQSGGLFKPNITLYGARPAFLEWTTDDRLRVVLRDQQTFEIVETYLDIARSEVIKVNGIADSMSLRTADKTYRFQQMPDAPLIVNELENTGIPVGFKHGRTIYAIIALGTVVGVVLLTFLWMWIEDTWL